MWWSATYQYIVIHPRHVAHGENSRGVPNVTRDSGVIALGTLSARTKGGDAQLSVLSTLPFWLAERSTGRLHSFNHACVHAKASLLAWLPLQCLSDWGSFMKCCRPGCADLPSQPGPQRLYLVCSKLPGTNGFPAEYWANQNVILQCLKKGD